MEMLTPEEEMIIEAADGRFRRMKRVEYEKLAAEGFFEDEKIELLFGMVVPMSPIVPAHPEAIDQVADGLRRQLGSRARVRIQSPFAATDDSEPQPDVFVFPPGSYWTEHRAALCLSSRSRGHRCAAIVSNASSTPARTSTNTGSSITQTAASRCIEVPRTASGRTPAFTDAARPSRSPHSPMS